MAIEFSVLIVKNSSIGRILHDESSRIAQILSPRTGFHASRYGRMTCGVSARTGPTVAVFAFRGFCFGKSPGHQIPMYPVMVTAYCIVVPDQLLKHPHSILKAFKRLFNHAEFLNCYRLLRLGHGLPDNRNNAGFTILLPE